MSREVATNDLARIRIELSRIADTLDALAIALALAERKPPVGRCATCGIENGHEAGCWQAKLATPDRLPRGMVRGVDHNPNLTACACSVCKPKTNLY